jgi:hypothetical protein
MIRLTEARGIRMEDDFQANWQANLGRAILTAGQDRAALSAQIQERIGAAITQVARAQAVYQKSAEAVQGQLAAAANAAIRTELRADLFDRLAKAELMAARQAAPQAAPVAEPQASPEIPIGYLMAATMGLIALFLGGLRFPSPKREEEPVEQTRAEAAHRMYRKTA